MFYAIIETDIGDILNVLRSDGRIGGKGILSFLTGLSGYCSENDVKADMQRWFSNLEAHATEPVCQLTQPLLQSFYQKWVDVELLLSGVVELTRALAEAKLEATWWYEPEATETDFQALSQTLSLAVERKANKARIKFT